MSSKHFRDTTVLLTTYTYTLILKSAQNIYNSAAYYLIDIYNLYNYNDDRDLIRRAPRIFVRGGGLNIFLTFLTHK